MVSAGLILTIVLIVGFVVFGGLQLTKDAVDETKAKVELIRSATKKRIEDIRSDDE